MNYSLDEYYAEWFLVDKYRKLYDSIIHPILDPHMWGETNLPTLDPPFELRKGGMVEKNK